MKLVKLEILNFAILALKEKLALPSNITFHKEEGDCGNFDAMIEILKVKFLCDIECNVTTANASTIVNRMRERMITEKRPAILVTKYINSALFEKLITYGINILDCAGNCYIRYTKGETNIFHLINKGEKNIFAKEKVYPIFQDAGIKVIFYLLQDKNNIDTTYREIQENTGGALGTVKNVID